MIEIQAIVLAAGRQMRYESKKSKLMVPVEGEPAFHRMMQSILANFPEELVTIISSSIFPDFNEYVIQEYPQALLLFDQRPGKGSVETLKTSLPWKTPQVFVSEANIAYSRRLPLNMYDSMQSSPSPVAVLAVTPRLEVADTHKLVTVDPTLEIHTDKKLKSEKMFRNMGAYVFQKQFQHELARSHGDIIDLIARMNRENAVVMAYKYYSYYFHTATIEDADRWGNKDKIRKE